MKKKSKRGKKPKRAVGRPRKEVSAQIVERLAQGGCNDTTIGWVCGVSADVISERFRDSLCTGRGKLRKQLFKKQVEIALKGNVTMLIWLGKQQLDQRDKAEIVEPGDPLADLLAEFKREHERSTPQLTQ